MIFLILSPDSARQGPDGYMKFELIFNKQSPKLSTIKQNAKKGTAKIRLSNNALVFGLNALGINKQWTSSSSLVDTKITNRIYQRHLGSITDLEFKLNAKTLYYFDKNNNSKKTDEAMFLCFGLLKNNLIPQN